VTGLESAGTLRCIASAIWRTSTVKGIGHLAAPVVQNISSRIRISTAGYDGF